MDTNPMDIEGQLYLQYDLCYLGIYLLAPLMQKLQHHSAWMEK